MKSIDLTKNAPLITDKSIAEDIYKQIISFDPSNNVVEIDMTGIVSMTTVCAKIMFGNVAKLISPDVFYKNIRFKGLTDELELIITMGITSAIDD